MTRPSVLFINRAYPPDRAVSGFLLRDLAECLAREGWSVTVLATGDKTEQSGANGVTISSIRVPAGRGFFKSAYTWFRLCLSACRIPRHDIVITLSDPPMVYVAGYLQARFKKTKHVHWCHELYPDLFGALGYRLPDRVGRTLLKYSRRIFKSCSAVVSIGQCMQKYLTQTGMDMTRLYVIPNWADRDVVSTERHPPLPVRADIQGAKPQDRLIRDTSARFRILYAGSIGREHPMQSVLDAAQMLQVHAEIEFLFAGHSAGFERLARERDRRGLTNIRFIPYQPAQLLRHMMESADLHLVTQKLETTGMLVPCKTYSAFAVGRPCLYLGHAGTETARMIEAYHAGQVISPGDAQGLADAILTYRMKRDIWDQAHQGAMRAGLDYTPGMSMSLWTQLLDKIITPSS
jgi:glycosyltransferase involved in cell wall biosynthesis